MTHNTQRTRLTQCASMEWKHSLYHYGTSIQNTTSCWPWLTPTIYEKAALCLRMMLTKAYAPHTWSGCRVLTHDMIESSNHVTAIETSSIEGSTSSWFTKIKHHIINHTFFKILTPSKSEHYWAVLMTLALISLFFQTYVCLFWLLDTGYSLNRTWTHPYWDCPSNYHIEIKNGAWPRFCCREGWMQYAECSLYVVACLAPVRVCHSLNHFHVLKVHQHRQELFVSWFWDRQDFSHVFLCFFTHLLMFAHVFSCV